MINKHTFTKNERKDYSDINCHWWHGSKVNDHYHSDYYEVIISTLGEFENKIEGQTYSQSKGDVIIISPGTVHSIDASKKGEHYNIAVRSEYFERLIADKNAVKKSLRSDKLICLKLNDTEYSYVYDCISKINNVRIGAFSATLVQTVLSVIFLSVMEMSIPDEESAEKTAYYCRDAISKIDGGSLTVKSAKDIYELYPVSHTAFISEFKRITSKTPSDYLRDSKLAYAKKLLLTTNDSILDIAYEVGYDSVSHFIKCFKAFYGQTPLKYKNSHKNK